MARGYSIMDGLFRFYQQWSFHRRWFGVDKPFRDKVGHDQWPMSEADKERHGLKEPDQKNPCAA